jgi:hypothetical protein
MPQHGGDEVTGVTVCAVDSLAAQGFTKGPINLLADDADANEVEARPSCSPGPTFGRPAAKTSTGGGYRCPDDGSGSVTWHRRYG